MTVPAAPVSYRAANFVPPCTEMFTRGLVSVALFAMAIAREIDAIIVGLREGARLRSPLPSFPRCIPARHPLAWVSGLALGGRAVGSMILEVRPLPMSPRACACPSSSPRMTGH